MTRIHRSIVLALVLFTALAGTAQAFHFTVTLTNGTTFETRYRPVDAEWDPNIKMVMTDQGNWIALHKDEIADVISQAEESGFGVRVDTTTIFLGVSPNDMVNDEEDGEQRYDFSGASAVGDNYSIDQFLTVPVAGDPTATQGALPVFGTVSIPPGQ